MNVSLLIPAVPAQGQPGQAAQQQAENQDFLTQLLQPAQADTSAHQGLASDGLASQARSSDGNELQSVPAQTLQTTAEALRLAFATAEHTLATQGIGNGAVARTVTTPATGVTELYLQQWLATGHLSYLAKAPHSSANDMATLHHETSRSAAAATVVVDNTADRGATAASLRANIAPSNVMSAQGTTTADSRAEDWQQSLTQAIHESVQPWLRRRVAVQFGADGVHIIIRDFNASDAEQQQLLTGLLNRLHQVKPEFVRVTINGRDLNNTDQAALTFSENHHAS